MNIDDIKQLVQLMVDNDLSEIDITNGESKILLKRGLAGAPAVLVQPAAVQVPAAAVPAAPAPEEAPAAETLIEIKSPMVGTFYSAASPDAEPYVRVGTVVNDDSVVCVVEAMKVMNEIKAESSGAIVEVCVKNAQPVEYGQVLFRVRPA